MDGVKILFIYFTNQCFSNVMSFLFTFFTFEYIFKEMIWNVFFLQAVTTTTSNLERIRQPPFVTRPIPNQHSDLLRMLLEKIRHHVKSQPRLTSLISHQIKQQHKKTSDSSESAAQQGSRSSDSSDESQTKTLECFCLCSIDVKNVINVPVSSIDNMFVSESIMLPLILFIKGL